MKVLITTASRHGAAAEIAQAIGTTLRQERFDVDIRTPEGVLDVDEYDAVILGSGVYAGHWLKSAKEFAFRFGTELQSRPVFLFSCGPLGDPAKPTEVPVDVASINRATGAADHRIFSGRLDKADLRLPERVVVATVRAPYGDFRDWDEIAEWARGIATTLRPEAVSV